MNAGPGQAERVAHRTQASTASCGGARGNTWLLGRLPEAGVPEGALAVLGPPAAPTGGTQQPPGARRELPRPGFHDNPRETNTEAQHSPASRKRNAASPARPHEWEALVPGRLQPILPRGGGTRCPSPCPQGGSHTIGTPPPGFGGRARRRSHFPGVVSTGASQRRRGPAVLSAAPTGRTARSSHPARGALGKGGPGGAGGGPNDPPTKESQLGRREVGMGTVVPAAPECTPYLCLG